ncbi:hypothetical protein GQ42DRAFT_160577 [Ramicandelaber brevisporus]|nr:hypothetical protein GQ42DRAFT_165775 [Ramicandelaber brevisporus]KAI8873374.1 hypothetical protein GQ42DRAFT_160577 [Ramicandelaber brevisporus]
MAHTRRLWNEVNLSVNTGGTLIHRNGCHTNNELRATSASPKRISKVPPIIRGYASQTGNLGRTAFRALELLPLAVFSVAAVVVAVVVAVAVAVAVGIGVDGAFEPASSAVTVSLC